LICFLLPLPDCVIVISDSHYSGDTHIKNKAMEAIRLFCCIGQTVLAVASEASENDQQ
jgi:hypothetical protein